MFELLAVGAGGALGSISRLLVSRAFSPLLAFPYPTLIVNLLGSFFIGYLAALFHEHDKEQGVVVFFLIVGFLGGFTTFSAFSYELFEMLRREQYILLVTYIGVSLGGGVLLALFGWSLVR